MKILVNIPKGICTCLGLKPGQRLMFISYKKRPRFVIVPPIEQARGMFAGVDQVDIREETDENR